MTRKNKTLKFSRLALLLSVFTLAAALCLTLASCEKGDKEQSESSESGEEQNESTGENESSENTEADTTPIVSAAESAEQRITFLAAGDNVIHTAVLDDAKNGESYDFTKMFTPGVSEMISKADVAFISQETVMADDAQIQGYPKYNSPRALGDNLVSLGFDIVSVASNHMLDMDASGMIATYEWWNTAHPKTLITGFYRSEEDFNKPRVYIEEKSGIKIVMLSYTYYNYQTVDDDCGVWVPFISESDMTKQVNAAKSLGDVIVVSMHWGGETENTMNESQEKYAQLLCDLGVDVVIGTHPFYLQPVQMLTNAEGHSTLVAYSLGNFLSGMLSPRALLGGVLTFDIVKNGSAVKIENPMLNPVYCHYSGDSTGFEVYRLEDYTQKLVALHGAQETEPFSIYDLRNIVKQTIEGQYLPEDYKD